MPFLDPPNLFVQPPESPKPVSVSRNTKGQWITGIVVTLVMASMGMLAFVLALWTQPQRRARDLPPTTDLPDRLVAKVAFEGDLLVWARGDIPLEVASGDPLARLFPFPMEHQSGASVLLAWLQLRDHLQLGKSLEWAIGRNFEKNPSNKRGGLRLAVQLEKAPQVPKIAEVPDIFALGGQPGRFRFKPKPPFSAWEWDLSKGGLMTAQWNSPPVEAVPFSPSEIAYDGALAPDLLELRVSKIPKETPAWLMARGGPASREAAQAVLGSALQADSKGERIEFPMDRLVFGLWEEGGQLRGEWIFAEVGPALAWEGVLQKAQLGAPWKWLRQGKVVSLQWQKSGLFTPLGNRAKDEYKALENKKNG